jgi:hypothetical protein
MGNGDLQLDSPHKHGSSLLITANTTTQLLSGHRSSLISDAGVGSQAMVMHSAKNATR